MHSQHYDKDRNWMKLLEQTIIRFFRNIILSSILERNGRFEMGQKLSAPSFYLFWHKYFWDFPLLIISFYWTPSLSWEKSLLCCHVLNPWLEFFFISVSVLTTLQCLYSHLVQQCVLPKSEHHHVSPVSRTKRCEKVLKGRSRTT